MKQSIRTIISLTLALLLVLSPLSSLSYVFAESNGNEDVHVVDTEVPTTPNSDDLGQEDDDSGEPVIGQPETDDTGDGEPTDPAAPDTVPDGEKGNLLEGTSGEDYQEDGLQGIKPEPKGPEPFNVLGGVQPFSNGGNDLLNTNAEIVLTDEVRVDDVKVDTNSNGLIEVDKNSTGVWIDYYLFVEIKNDDYKIESGNYVIRDLPFIGPDVEISEDDKTGVITADIEHEGATIKLHVGEYQVTDDNRLKIIFTNDPDDFNKYKGIDLKERKAHATVGIKLSNTGNMDQDAIQKYELLDGDSIFVKRTSDKGYRITKEHIENEPEDSADVIRWQIDVNTNLEVIEEAIIIDELPSGLEYKDVEVYNLNVKSNGDLIKETPALAGYEVPTVEGNEVSINLGNLDREARRIVLVTEIKEPATETGTRNFINNAQLYDGQEKRGEEVEATASIYRIVGVEKTVGGGDNPIEWTITYIGDGEEGSTTDITDQFVFLKIEDPEEEGASTDDFMLHLVGDVKLNGNDLVSPQNAKISQEEKSIIFENMPNEKGKEYTITFSTRVAFGKDPNVDALYTVKNTAEHGDHSDSASKDIVVKESSEKEFSKIFVEDGKTKVSWTITVNQNNENWADSEIREYVPSGFVFKKAEKKVGDEWEGLTATKVSADGENKGYEKIELGPISEETTIIITTYIDPEPNSDAIDLDEIFEDLKEGEISNEASVGWKYAKEGGIGEGTGGPGSDGDGGPGADGWYWDDITGGFYSKELDIKLSKKPLSADSSTKIVNNHTKEELEWEIGVTSYVTNLKGYTLIDTLTTDNHSYITDLNSDLNSFEIKFGDGEYNELNIGKNNSINIDSQILNYSLSVTTRNDETPESFKLVLESGDFVDNNKFKNFKIKYKTSFDILELEDQEQGNGKYNKFTNEVKLYEKDGDDDHVNSANEEQKLGPRTSNNGYKKGSFNSADRTMDWYVELNHKSRTIKTTENITDKLLPKDTHFYEGNILIYQAQLKDDGKDELEKVGTEPIKTITPDDNTSKVTISFENDINHPIIIEYKTKAAGISEGEYSNELVFKGKTYSDTAKHLKSDDYITKEHYGTERILVGEELKWRLRINDSLSFINEFTLEDNLGEGSLALVGQPVVYKLGTPTDTPSDSNKVDGFEFVEMEPHGFKLKESVSLEDKVYIIEYTTVVIKEGTFNNQVKIGYDGKEQSDGDDFTSESRSGGGGSAILGENEIWLRIEKVMKTKEGEEKLIKHSPAKFKFKSISVYRDDEDNIIQQIPIEYDEVYSTLEGISQEIKLNKDRFKDGSVMYYIKEIEAPIGYQRSNVISNMEGWIYVNPDNVTFSDDETVVTITVKNEKITKDLPVKKIWEGGSEWGKSSEVEIFINLSRKIEKDGTDIEDTGFTETLELTTDDTEGIFENLDTHSDDGYEYYYSIEEVVKIGGEVNETNYEVDISPKDPINLKELGGVDNPITGFEITNTYVPSLVEVEAKKTWIDGKKEDKEKERPEVWFELYRTNDNPDMDIDGEKVPAESHVENPKKAGRDAPKVIVSWEDLPETDADGYKYSYFVKEVVPVVGSDVYEEFESDEYYSEYEVEGEETNKLSIINTQYKTVVAEKKWVYGPSSRPNIYFKLFRKAFKDDKFTEEEEVKFDVEGKENIVDQQPLSKNDWKVQWEKLPVTDDEGNFYTYFVKEVNGSGKEFTPINYDKKHDVKDPLKITNTYKIPKTSYTAEKIWKGIDSEKPTIQLQLYRNGSAYGEPVTLKDGQTSYTWTNLDRTNLYGSPHSYTVDEVEVPEGFVKVVSGNTITNRLIEEGFVLSKTDFSTAEPLPNTKISVYKEDGTLVAEKVTDEDGLAIFEKLSYGKYYFVESEAPEGYVLNTDKHYFEISEDGKTVKAELKNHIITGTFELSKVDASTAAPLPNTTISVYTEDGELVDRKITDKDGLAIFEGLTYGKYYFEETEAPEGYILNDAKHFFEIKENGKIVKATLENVKSGMDSEDPDKDDKDKDKDKDDKDKDKDDKDKDKDDKDKDKEKLPSTGAAPMAGMLFSGIALLGGAFVLLRKKED